MTDFSQYYDPSTYWQNSAAAYSQQTWPTTYDSTAVGQTDYAAYYQQQMQNQTTFTQQQNGATAAISHATTYSHHNEDLALVGKII